MISKNLKKVDKRKKVSKVLVPALILITIALVVLLSNSSTEKKNCQTICKENNFSGAVEDSCTIFTNCLAPNYPLTNHQVKNFCSGNFDVCCCVSGEK